MPRASGTNIAIFIFLVIVLALILAAIIGYTSGRWEMPPPTAVSINPRIA